MKLKLMFIFLIFILSCDTMIRMEKPIKEISKREYYYQKIENNLIVDTVFLCANRFGLSHELIFAIILNESAYNPKAININDNGSKDYSLMQLNSYTFKHLTITEMYDIEVNIFNGTKLLAGHMQKYHNNEIKALCSYNGGEWKVDTENIKSKVIDYAYRVLKSKTKYEIEYLEFKIKKDIK